jgi:hypothetical protein
MNEGVFFGIVLIMGFSFTVYSELSRNTNYTEFISLGYYINDVFKALTKYYILSAILPVVLLSVLLYPETALITTVVVLILGLYYLSVLLLAAGLQPEEALFDVVRFTFITIFIGFGSVPILVGSLFADPQLWTAVVESFVGTVPENSIEIALGGYLAVLGILAVVFRVSASRYWDVKARFDS